MTATLRRHAGSRWDSNCWVSVRRAGPDQAMDDPELWVVGQRSPVPELTEEPGAGWQAGGLLLICDDLTADDARDFDGGRVHLTAHGPLVGLTLQGRGLAIDLLSGRRPDEDRPEWADPDTAITASSRAAFTLTLVDHRSQVVVAMRMF